MERNSDTSGRMRWWKYALKDIWIEQFGADGLDAVAESNEQVLTFTEAIAYEEDLLTARDRSVIWADPLKGNRRRENMTGRAFVLGVWLMQTSRKG